MDGEKIYFMEGNHPGVVYHGPRSALESRQMRDGGFWIVAPSPSAFVTPHKLLLNTGEVVREVDAEGWLISHDTPKST